MTDDTKTSALSASTVHPHPGALEAKMQKLRVQELTHAHRLQQAARSGPRRPIGAKRPRRELRFSGSVFPQDPWRRAPFKGHREISSGARSRAAVSTRPQSNSSTSNNNSNHGRILQVPDITEPAGEGSERDAFRSASLACEMVFREAKNALELQQDDSSERKPNTDFISICCRVLGELAPTCGTSRRLVTELREEFARHIYADFAKPAPGRTTLCQQPYFEIVDSHKAQVEDLLQETARQREQIQQEIARRRDTELVLQRLSSQLSERDRALQDTREALARLVHSTEASRDNYNRMRQDHEDIARELQVVVRAKEEAELESQQKIEIHQIRLAQLAADLNKALQELKQKNEEIHRLKVVQR